MACGLPHPEALPDPERAAGSPKAPGQGEADFTGPGPGALEEMPGAVEAQHRHWGTPYPPTLAPCSHPWGPGSRRAQSGGQQTQ